MNKTMAAVVVAGTVLAGLAAADPALAVAGDTQVCSSANGGTMVNGVCVLPALNVGQNAEEFLMNTGGGVDTWTIVAGSIPPGWLKGTLSTVKVNVPCWVGVPKMIVAPAP